MNSPTPASARASGTASTPVPAQKARPEPISEPAVDELIHLARLSFGFARVERRTYFPDGTTPESDTDHTVMLGLVACSFAARYRPDLDPGMVAQFALVHDLPEVYAGDVNTFRRLSPAARAAKESAEAAAIERIRSEAAEFPWLAETIERYEARETPEARFVKAIDKVLPKLTHLLNDCRVPHEEGVTPEELAEGYRAQLEDISVYASDLAPFLDLYQALAERVVAEFGAPQDAPSETSHATPLTQED